MFIKNTVILKSTVYCRTTKGDFIRSINQYILSRVFTWPHYLNAHLSHPGVPKNIIIVEQLRWEFQLFSIWKNPITNSPQTHTHRHTQLSHSCADTQKHFLLSQHTCCPECFLSSSHPLWLFPTSDHIQETLTVHTGSFVFVGIYQTFSLSSRKDMRSVFYSFCRKSSSLGLRFILWNPGKGTRKGSGKQEQNITMLIQRLFFRLCTWKLCLP